MIKLHCLRYIVSNPHIDPGGVHCNIKVVRWFQHSYRDPRKSFCYVVSLWWRQTKAWQRHGYLKKVVKRNLHCFRPTKSRLQWNSMIVCAFNMLLYMYMYIGLYILFCGGPQCRLAFTVICANLLHYCIINKNVERSESLKKKKKKKKKFTPGSQTLMINDASLVCTELKMV